LKTIFHLLLALFLIAAGIYCADTRGDFAYLEELSGEEVEESINEASAKTNFRTVGNSVLLQPLLQTSYQSFHHHVRELHFSPDCPEQFYYELMDESV
jgi:hypothetical protein